MLAMPDPNTFELLPWRRRRRPVGPDVLRHRAPRRRRRSRATPARCCKRNLDRAREKGFTFFVAPEMEFFYFAVGDPTPPEPLDHAGYFDLTTADVGQRRCASRRSARSRRWASRSSTRFHEDGPSQHEIDLRYTDALTMADNVMTFRLVVQGGRRTSTACTPRSCPSRSRACRARACTRTCRCSRATSTRSTTPATRTACRRSAKRFIAGLLAPRRARSPRSPTSGQLLQAADRRATRRRCYVALGPQQPLGARAGAGHRSRASERSTRIEYRSPDPACNPYLAFSVMLAAGLQGHRGGLRAAARGRPTTSSR